MSPIVDQVLAALRSGGVSTSAGVPTEEGERTASTVSKMLMLIRAYQIRGHEIAKTDPLNLEDEFGQHGKKKRPFPKELDPAYYGFTEADMNQEYTLDASFLGGFLSQKKKWTLRELI